MATLEKKTLIGLLGERAGTKLFSWLSPCCGLTFRAEVRCNPDEPGNICIDYYATSLVTVKDVRIQASVRFTHNQGIEAVVDLVAGVETFLDTKCVPEPTVPGEYVGVGFAFFFGEPVIPQPIYITVPSCGV